MDQFNGRHEALQVISNKLVVCLLIFALVLPVALCVLLAAAHLLHAMGDPLWSSILLRAALVGGLVWAVTLVSLLLALAAHMVGQSDSSDDSQDG